VISSIVIKKDTSSISFTKLEIELETGKMIMLTAEYEFNEDMKEHVEKKHRLFLPCSINETHAVFYVPDFWDGESIENYTQALLDELYLLRNNMEGCKTKEMIEKSFMLEIILL
jgi:hypothetical protein